MVRIQTSNPGPSNSAYIALITSDWHIEPWFSTGGADKNNWSVSTIDKWSKPTKISCNAVGEAEKGDTPISLVKSAIEKYVQRCS